MAIVGFSFDSTKCMEVGIGLSTSTGASVVALDPKKSEIRGAL
jgi:hypothetical protein